MFLYHHFYFIRGPGKNKELRPGAGMLCAVERVAVGDLGLVSGYDILESNPQQE